MGRPLPRPSAETKPFWDGCSEGELRYQVCASCGAVQLIPHAICEACHHDRLDWRVSEGTGRIISHTTVYRAPTPAFRDDVPYVIALLGMDEGFRLMVNLRGGERSGAFIGARVRVGFCTVDGVALPQGEVVG